ncbi:hypothetical protein ACE04B_37195, partial [Rhizobium phaseoli]
MPHTTRFFEELGRGDAELILDSLLEFPEVTSDVDRVLSYVGETHLDCVWDYLGRRLDHPKEGIEGTRYKAAPHRFHRLVVTLSSDAALAVAKVRAWFDKTSTLFSYYGGRVLTAVFPQMTEAFAATLLSEVAKGRPEDAKFVVAVMQNYRGEAETHGILKELLRKFPEDEDVKDGVARSIRNTGVVHGEFGFVENIRDKKALLEPWLEEDETVAQFARQQVAEM